MNRNAVVAHSAFVNITNAALLLVHHLDFAQLWLIKYDHRFPDVRCNSNGLFGICPAMPYGDVVHAEPSEHELANNFARLERVLASLMPTRPSVVTIARSLEGYTPHHLFKTLEERVLSML